MHINTLYICTTMRGGKRRREGGRRGREREREGEGRSNTGRSRYRLMHFKCLQRFNYQGMYCLQQCMHTRIYRNTPFLSRKYFWMAIVQKFINRILFQYQDSSLLKFYYLAGGQWSFFLDHSNSVPDARIDESLKHINSSPIATAHLDLYVTAAYATQHSGTCLSGHLN